MDLKNACDIVGHVLSMRLFLWEADSDAEEQDFRGTSPSLEVFPKVGRVLTLTLLLRSESSFGKIEEYMSTFGSNGRLLEGLCHIVDEDSLAGCH